MRTAWMRQDVCVPALPHPRPTLAVLLPGTGTDAALIARVFAPALSGIGVTTLAVQPQPTRLVAGYLQALDRAAGSRGPILVGGVSIGAAVAAEWASRNPGRVAGVLAALPAWLGDPADAPAAVSARYTSAQLRAHGLDATVAQMRAGSPAWLADELEHAWRAQWPALPDAMEEVARYSAVTAAVLRRVAAPVGLAAAVGDPVHPREAALEWLAHLPQAAVREIGLEAVGRDVAALGQACLAALLDAADSPSLGVR